MATSEIRTPNDLAALFAAVEKINHRLDKLERNATKPLPAITRTNLPHPSLEKFNIAEAIADEVFAKFGNEKACTFEPNDKPCDHCAMCSSRGF